jgi:hypothetical protein
MTPKRRFVYDYRDHPRRDHLGDLRADLMDGVPVPRSTRRRLRAQLMDAGMGDAEDWLTTLEAYGQAHPPSAGSRSRTAPDSAPRTVAGWKAWRATLPGQRNAAPLPGLGRRLHGFLGR